MLEKKYTDNQQTDVFQMTLKVDQPAFKYRLLRNSQLFDCLCFLVVFSLALFLGWLLSLAYPYGFQNGETAGYEGLGRDFHWFKPNPLDWWRTIPFSAVINFSTKLDNPTNGLFWVNTVLFSLGSALVFYLGRALFASRAWGLALALVALLFEIVCMGVFYNDLQASADPFFAVLIHVGVVLALIGWIRRSPVIFVVGYTVIALAVFTKPCGLPLLPLWAALAFLTRPRWSSNNRKNLVIVLASSVILIAPVTLWSLRNFYVYGHAKVSGAGGCSLLLATLPILRNHDQLFNDAKSDLEFIYSVRDCEMASKFSCKPDASLGDRTWRYENYFMWDNSGPPGPFEYLAARVNPFMNRGAYRIDSATMFMVDDEASRIALRIICLHPFDYVRRTIQEYATMFSPLELARCAGVYNYNSNLTDAYDLMAPRIYPDHFIYPLTGVPTPGKENQAIADSIALVIENPIVRSICNSYFASELLLSHFIFLAAVAGLIVGLKRPPEADGSKSIYNLNVTLIMLFLTASLMYFAVAVAQTARKRYALAGDLELHLMALIALFFLLRWLCSGPTLAVIKSTFIRKRPIP